MKFTHQPTPVQAVISTKHGKEAQVGPALAPLGWELSVAAVDTDLLGTFSGLVPRRLSPLETARRKALMGAALAPAAAWLLASEGSVTAGALGMVQDHELVVAVEAASGLVVVGQALGLGLHGLAEEVDPEASVQDIIELCRRADLPRHRLMVLDAQRERALGNLASSDEVVTACRELGAGGGPLHLETDLRAHLCPSRQPTIAAAAEDLAERLACRCPSCGQRGFGEEQPELGLPCQRCAAPTQEVAARRLACPACSFEERRPVALEYAGPGSCPACNP